MRPSNPAFHLRPAAANDIPRLCDFADEFLMKMQALSGGKEARQVFQYVIKHPDSGIVIVAEHKNGICAYAYASLEWRSEFGGESMHCHDRTNSRVQRLRSRTSDGLGTDRMISVVHQPEHWDQETAVILAHGAGQGISSPFMTFFHRELAARGFLSAQFEFEYMADKRKVPDPQPKLRARYRQVIEEIEMEFRPKRIIIGGKSMGGRVASYVAGDIDSVSGLVFLGYPLHPPGKTHQLRDEHLYTLNRPMLFISGTRDTFAERDLLERVIHRIGQRATLIWIEGGDHSLKVIRKAEPSLPFALNALEHWIRP